MYGGYFMGNDLIRKPGQEIGEGKPSLAAHGVGAGRATLGGSGQEALTSVRV